MFGQLGIYNLVMVNVVSSVPFITLVVLVDHDHTAVPQTCPSRCVSSRNVAALDVLRHGGRHVDGLVSRRYNRVSFKDTFSIKIRLNLVILYLKTK